MRELEKSAKGVDLILCAGDITIFEQGLDKILKQINSWNKPVLMIHGNHESELILKKLAGYSKNILFLHKGAYKLKDILFFGYGGGGFSLNDSKFRNLTKHFEREIKVTKPKKIVLITHAPPHGTKLDLIMDEHCGNKDIKKFIERVDLDLVISGHIHETAGTDYVLKKTRLINPGPYGKVITL
jgi:Icc-related predicted phosphoesterase